MLPGAIRKLTYAVAVTTAIALGAAGVASAQTVIKVNSVTPNNMENSDTAQLVKFAERVEQKSGGQLKLDIHYSSSLVPQDQAFDALSAGLVDATWFTGSHFAGQVPEVDVYSLPFNFESHADFATKHVEGGLNQVLDDAFKEDGIKIIGGFPSSAMALIMTNKPVSSRDDIAGTKIRVFGPALANVVERLDASPVYVPFSELEVALDRGVADGFFTGWVTMAGMPGLRRVSKYVTWPPLQGSLGITFSMNRAVFDALSAEQQSALIEAAEEVAKEGEEWFASWEEEARRSLEESGVEFVELSDEELAAWREAIQPIWGDYVEKARKQSEAAGDRAARIVEIISDGN